MRPLEQDKYDSVAQAEDKPAESVLVESNLKGDRRNFLFLILLYVLQGIPQGISVAIPILLQNRGVTYLDQAGFSLAYFPFSMKLLWAPIVDSIYIKKFGRRKTWICSSQLLIGTFMIFTSFRVNDWMGNGNDKLPQIMPLTVVFFILWFLTSCQDIAVDGYGLTLLHRRNVAYAATANSVGATGGTFIGNILLLLLESKDFCNQYIFSEPRETGLFTLSGFLMFWAVAYISVTVLIAIFKEESAEDQLNEEAADYGIKKAFPILIDIVKLRPVLELVTMIFTLEACFAACEGIATLKFIEYGVPKEKFALLFIPTAPIMIFFPLFITKYTAGRKPLSFYFRFFPFRVLATLLITLYLLNTKSMLSNEASNVFFYVGLFLVIFFDRVMNRVMSAADGSFFAKVSDPLVGGTYITLMHTFSNLGRRIFTTSFLWLLDLITWKKCFLSLENSLHLNETVINACANIEEKNECTDEGGSCHTIVDGFYIEIGISVIIALLWYKFMKNFVFKLQRYPLESWYVVARNAGNN